MGIAISDEEGRIAFPKSVIPAGKNLVSAVMKICADENVGEIVIGESKDFSGTDNPIMTQILRFVAELRKETGLPVHLEPEFFTSAEAERIQGKNDMIDASAAALILKSYLDKIESSNK